MALCRSRPLVVMFAATLAASFASCGGSNGGENAEIGGKTLPSRTTEVGSVEVRVSPREMSDRRAVFAISLDTHSGDLDVDLTKSAILTVGGTTWPVTSFDGDGPGGHHREGTLRFRANGTPIGVMRLRIVGLATPATFTWSLAR